MDKGGFRLIENRPGTYALVLESLRAGAVHAGRLGALRLQAGFYVYIGSAFGPGGIGSRCRHHKKISAKPHWHIDYLRAVTCLREVWFSHDPQRREHQWADLMSRARGVHMPFPGFGSTDCGCLTHLFFFSAPPSFASFRRRALQAIAQHASILRERTGLD